MLQRCFEFDKGWFGGYRFVLEVGEGTLGDGVPTQFERDGVNGDCGRDDETVAELLAFDAPSGAAEN